MSTIYKSTINLINPEKNLVLKMEIEPHKSLEEKILSVEKDKVLNIFMHNGPDPDAMASALALSRIANHYGRQCKIYYDDDIDFPTNRIEVKLLDLPFTRISEPEKTINSMDYIALVDVASLGKINYYNLLYPKIIIDIDHHQTAKKTSQSCFTYKGSAGACISILIDFMRKMRIRLDTKKDKTLILASYLGLKTDTSGFYDKSMERLDYATKRYVEKMITDRDKRVLYDIEHPEIPKMWSIKLGQALVSMTDNTGNMFFKGLGQIDDTGIVPYVTEDIFRRRNFGTVIVYGLCYKLDEANNCTHLKIRASGRSNDKELNLGDLFSEVFYKDANDGNRIYAGSARKSTKFVTYAGAEISLNELAGNHFNSLHDIWKEWESKISSRLESKI